MTDLSQSAAALAAAGWRVHPLRPNSKLPMLPGWPELATSDAATVAAWWTETPAANIGIATGQRNTFVLDVDCKDGAPGFGSLAALEAKHGKLPDTLTAATASGGRHHFFTSGEVLRNSAGRIGVGLDIRGAGGYVVAAPSVIGGTAYRWMTPVQPIAEAPAWLVTLALAAAPVATGTTRTEPASIEATAEQMADAAGALDALDPDDRDVWIAAAASLRCLGEAGHSMWCEWSQRSAKWQDNDQGTFYTVAADHSGLPALFSRAQAAGWINPRRSSTPDAAAVFGGALVGRGAHNPCSHLANAFRIAKHYGAKLLHVDGIGWHVWHNGTGPWKHDEPGARRIVQGLGKLIAAEAGELGAWVAAAADKDQREMRAKVAAERFRWAGASESEKVLDPSMRMAATMLRASAADLDADPDVLGLPGGVLDLRTGIQRAYQQTDLVTKQAGCDFDPAALCPTWERFLTEAMGYDLQLVDYLQRLSGYSLSGRRADHLLPVLYGSGANGKSTYLGTLQTLLGNYASAAAPGLLIQRAADQHASATADLQGRRLVVVSETGEFGRLNEDQAKALTGGDRIKARRLYQNGFEFDPTHLIVLQTNHRPQVTGTDEGIWRRLRLIPFTVTVPAERRDPDLPAKLRAELPGILAWCYRGLQAYQRDGFRRTPAAVLAATAEYRTSSDQIGAWLEECCSEDRTATVPAGELYASYSIWCSRQGERPRSQRDLALRLTERGYMRDVNRRAGSRWQGLSLQNSVIFGVSENSGSAKLH